jgi:hypothetical protein
MYVTAGVRVYLCVCLCAYMCALVPQVIPLDQVTDAAIKFGCLAIHWKGPDVISNILVRLFLFAPLMLHMVHRSVTTWQHAHTSRGAFGPLDGPVHSFFLS